MSGIKPVQQDLFVLDSPLYGKVHGERSIMEFPFFGLSKKAKKQRIVYNSGNISVEVRPSDSGLATIYDKEVLLYIASLMAAKMDRGETVDQEFTFTAHDFFRVTGTSASARSYARLNEALTRLQGTQVMTNIKAGGAGVRGWFSWLEKAAGDYVEGPNGEERLKAIRVRLCDWLYRAILKERRILAYHLQYFKLGPIERRLYEVARSHCEATGTCTIDLDELRVKVGCTDSLAKFKFTVKGVIEGDVLPEYRVAFEELVEARQADAQVDAAPRRRRSATRTVVIFTAKHQNDRRVIGETLDHSIAAA
jgi:plasmid replication initiation protein